MMKKPNGTQILRLLALFFVFAVVNACDTFYWDSSNKKELVGNRKDLKVAIIQGAWTQQKIGGQTWGLESDLIQNFADEFGLDIQLVPVKSMRELELSLSSGKADIGAGRITGASKTTLAAGPSYQDTDLSLICHEDQVGEPEQIYVSGVNDSLELRRELSSLFPKSEITVVDKTTLALKKIFITESACSVLESGESQFYLRYYPSLQTSQLILDNQSLHFLVSKNSLRLQRMLYIWNQKASQNGQLLRIKDKYTRPLRALNTQDVDHFFSLMADELHQYEGYFKKAAREHRIPWQLLAAVSFQESNWQDEARSYTGVRGLMMLTEDTAEHVGVTDRTDPEQSIWGGAKYLKRLLAMQPTILPLRERWALALASYNVGFGHVKDAQKIAVSLGKNPYSWHDLREVLPLLANPRYLSQLEYGAARGKEPVEFTERVLGYLDLMTTPLE